MMNKSYKNIEWITLIIFAVFNVVLLGLIEPTNRLLNDGHGYYLFGQSLFVGDGFHTLTRQPLYSLLVAGSFFLSEANAISVIIGFQVVLAFLTAFYARKIAQFFDESLAPYVFCLVLLNPNALAHLNILNTDIVYAFFVVGAVAHYLSWQDQLHSRDIIWLAVYTACASLTRPEGKVLLYLTPLALIFYAVLSSRLKVWSLRTVLVLGVYGIISITVVSPWALYISEKTGGVSVSSNHKKIEHFAWNITLIEAHRDNHTNADQYYDEVIWPQTLQSLAEEKKEHPEWTLQDERSWLEKYLLSKLFSYGFWDYFSLWLNSLVKLFIASGSQNFIVMFDQEKISNATYYEGSALSNSTSDNIWPLALSVVTSAFAFLCRVFGVIGFIVFIKNCRFKEYYLPVALVTLTIAIVIFNGHGRFRLSIEPILMLWAVMGASSIYGYIRGRKYG